MKIATNEVMKGIVWIVIGWAICFHWYDVAGQWGTRNALAHIARVSVADCEKNASTALQNDADVTDVKHCPKPPVVAPTKTVAAANNSGMVSK